MGKVRWLPVRRAQCLKILDFIDLYMAENGFAPSRREIGAGCLIVLSSIAYYLDIMKQAGWIYYPEGLSRAIKITEDGDWELRRFRGEKRERR